MDELFEIIDVSNDGHISYKELQQALVRPGGCGIKRPTRAMPSRKPLPIERHESEDTIDPRPALHAHLLALELRACEMQLGMAPPSTAQMQLALQQAREEADSLRRQLDGTAAHDSQLVEALRNDLRRRSEELGTLQREVAGRRDEIESLQRQVAGRGQEIDALQREVAGRRDEIESLQRQVADRGQEIGALRTELSTQTVALSRSEAEVGELRAVVPRKEAEVAELRAVAAEARTRMAAMERALAEEVSKLEAQVDRSLAERRRAAAELAAATAEAEARAEARAEVRVGEAAAAARAAEVRAAEAETRAATAEARTTTWEETAATAHADGARRVAELQRIADEALARAAAATTAQTVAESARESLLERLQATAAAAAGAEAEAAAARARASVADAAAAAGVSEVERLTRLLDERSQAEGALRRRLELQTVSTTEAQAKTHAFREALEVAQALRADPLGHMHGARPRSLLDAPASGGPGRAAGDGAPRVADPNVLKAWWGRTC